MKIMTINEFKEVLDKTPTSKLKKLGFRIFDDEQKIDGQYLHLIPKDFYEYIPDDYELVDLFGEIIKFKKGQTPKGTRFGLLTYGVLRKYK